MGAILGQVGVAVGLVVLAVPQAPVVLEVQAADLVLEVSQAPVVVLVGAQALVVLAENLALTGWAVLDDLSLFLEVEILLVALQFQLDMSEAVPLMAKLA